MAASVRYVLLGVAAMAAAEFQANVLLRGNLATWFMALGMYAVVSLAARGVGRWVRSEAAFYFGGGLLGLLVVEWWLMGFHPGSGKPGIDVAMFTNWAAVFSVPRLFTSPAAGAAVRRGAARTMIAYAALAPPLVLLLPVPRGGTVAILMAAYSLVLGFQLAPFVAGGAAAAVWMRRLLWLGAAGAVLDVAMW